ncbi:ABC transporter substrate-binding protein [Streptomyces sp. NPDC127068]|uniref:ABC transporter substrate-binding protein n=1 Tax=Streptomyces sp. NPDC127068 TaxID=3347127 RepID=UPI0036483881
MPAPVPPLPNGSPAHHGSTRRSTDRRGLLKLLGAGGVAVAAGGALAGCSSRDVQDGKGAAPSGSAGFTVTDQRGVKVSFDGPVSKIATTVIPSPSILAAVDGGVDRIVGINESTLVANKQGIFGEMFPASTKTRTVSGSDFVPNVETLLSLKPDVVIQWGDMGDEVIAPLENAGFKVIGLTYGTQEKLETWISLFGKLTGNESRADDLVSWMHAEKTAVSALVRGQQRTGQKVLYLRAAADGWTSYNGSGYMNFCTELVGGVNPAKDLKAASPQVSTEQILEWDPDVILLSAFDEKPPAALYGDPKLARVRAVRDRRVYKIPLGGYRWDPPCAESPLMWRWMTQVLYPSTARAGGLRAQLTGAFDRLYGYRISAAQVDDVLRLDLNSRSSGHDGFRA